MLIEKLKEEFLSFRKSGNKTLSLLCSTFIGELENQLKNGSPNTDDTFIKLAEKFIKNAKTIQTEASNSEITFLSSFLPQKLTENELGSVVINIISELKGDNKLVNMGVIMGLLNKKHPNCVDNTIAPKIINELLNNSQ